MSKPATRRKLRVRVEADAVFWQDCRRVHTVHTVHRAAHGLVYNIAGAALNVNKSISGTGTLSVTGNQAVNFASGTVITTTGSQTYSATATTARYYGFNLTDSATGTVTLGNFSGKSFTGPDLL